MLRALVLLFLLVGCGEDEKGSSTCTSPSDPLAYATSICAPRLGVKAWGIEDGSTLALECVDGSEIYLKNYSYP